MKTCKVIFSAQEPNARETLWLKPVSGGFSLYFLSGGRWLPLKLIDDNGTSNNYSGTYTKVFAAKLLSFTNGKFSFSYDWKCKGESV